jgi:hypothetical protein
MEHLYVLGIINNLEIKSIWEDVYKLYANTMPSSLRDAHLWILVSERVLESITHGY